MSGAPLGLQLPSSPWQAQQGAQVDNFTASDSLQLLLKTTPVDCLS